jgi:nucleotide-binding universal stress UspA family protein
VIVVCVTPLVGNESVAWALPLSYGAVNEARDQMTEQLAGEVAQRAGELGIEVCFVRARGDVAQELVRVARTSRADLIAIGRSSKILHRVAGSLGRRLVLGRDLPVLVVVP